MRPLLILSLFCLFRKTPCCLGQGALSHGAHGSPSRSSVISISQAGVPHHLPRVYLCSLSLWALTVTEREVAGATWACLPRQGPRQSPWPLETLPIFLISFPADRPPLRLAHVRAHEARHVHSPLERWKPSLLGPIKPGSGPASVTQLSIDL